MEDKDLYSGFIRLHVLHRASEGEVLGLDMIEELGRTAQAKSGNHVSDPARPGEER